MNARTAVLLTADYNIPPALAASPAMRADYAQATHEDLTPCPWCQHEGHWIRWRAYPIVHPTGMAPYGAIEDLVEGCHCCLWGRGPTRGGEPLIRRLEAASDRDVQIEHLDRDGHWTTFEERF